MTDQAVDLELANRARTELGDAISVFLAERTAVDSPLFDVSTKMVYGNYASIRSMPLLVDLANARATPEEIGQRLKKVGVQLGLVVNGLGWVITMGRLQVYLDAGWPDKQDVVVPEDERGAEVLTWWARVMQAYRNDGLLIPGHGGAEKQYQILPPEVAQSLADDALAHGPVSDVAKVRRSIAELDMFEFVTHAEARDGIHHHGLYDVGEGRGLLVKEFTDLQGRYMPDITDENRLPVSKVVMALVLKDVRVDFDIFAIFADPENYLDHLEGLEILAGDDLQPITIEQLGEITAAANAAQRSYFRKMARWDDRLKVTHASWQYANDFHEILLLAGYSIEEIDELWVKPFVENAEAYFDRSLAESRMAVFVHLMTGAQPLTPDFPQA